MDKFFLNTLHLTLTAAPWLLGGFLAAGLIRAFVPKRLLARVLGQRGLAGVVKASLIGIPLPLCSCGVLPTAVGLRRQGASKSSTVAFLISTPEIGLDSFALSYALLGPFMAIVRPISAFFSAVLAGLLTVMAVRRTDPPVDADAATATASNCCGGESAQPRQTSTSGSCCGQADDETAPAQSCCSEPSAAGSIESPVGWRSRLSEAMGYVFTGLLDDISIWLAVALVVAGAMTTFLNSNQWLIVYGSHWYAMVVMLGVGVPLYVCASASTPVAAGLLAAGLSPGVVLVFLLAGPATNLGSIGVLRKELGWAVVSIYLLAIAVGSVTAGLIVNAIVAGWRLDILAQVSSTGRHEQLPYALTVPSAVVLMTLAIRPLRRMMFSWFAPPTTAD